MSEKPFFETMMANNPYFSMSEDNPFVAMMKNNHLLNPSEENPFVVMMKNNPFLNPSDENPCVAMMKNNPFLNPSEENPFLAMMKDNPFLAPTDGNPFLTMMKENPFLEMIKGNPMLSENNPFLEMLKGWPSLVGGENPFILMAQNIPYANLYSEWMQAANQMWDMWLVGLGSLSWTQNEFENATRKQLGEMKAAREDLTKVAKDMGKQAAKNQISIMQALEDAVIRDQDS